MLVLPSSGQADEGGGRNNFNAALTRLGLPLTLGPLVSSARGGYDTPGRQRAGAAASAGSVYAPLFENIPGLERIKVFARRSLPSAEGSPAAAAGGGAAAPTLWDLPLESGGTFLRLVQTPRLKAMVAGVDFSNPQECEMPETPVFVPFMQALSSLLTETGPILGHNYLVGETVRVFFNQSESTGRMAIHGPADSRFRLTPGRLLSYNFQHTDLPGMYRIFERERLIGAFGVGIDPQESDLRLEKKATLEKLFSETDLRVIAPEDEIAGAVFMNRGGVEAWPVLVILAILLLIIEQVVANKKK